MDDIQRSRGVLRVLTIPLSHLQLPQLVCEYQSRDSTVLTAVRSAPPCLTKKFSHRHRMTKERWLQGSDVAAESDRNEIGAEYNQGVPAFACYGQNRWQNSERLTPSQ